MEYLGQTNTGTYTTGPRLETSQTFLPHIGNAQNVYRSTDTFPAPSPMRRSMTTMPWKPSSYYQTARVNPGSALINSMPTQMEKGPTVFAAARNALYTRYTPGDWMKSNQSNYLASDQIRTAAERLRLDTVRLCRETNDKTKHTQSDVGKRLGNRIGDIQFWKTELHHETDEMMTEISALNEAKRVMEKVLQETEHPLKIAQECLYHREKRQAIDLVHDNVEKELISEVDITKRCQEKMRQTIYRANVQLGLNRAAQHELEKDTRDKFLADNLDTSCHQLRNTSHGLGFHNGVDRMDNTVTVPETWANFSNNNIQRSQSERAASKQMRNEIESVLNQSSNEMWQEWNAVNVSFSRRIEETNDTRNKMQHHLSKVLQEIFDMEKNIDLLKKSIQDKEAPMQVAQSRLDTRLRRPNVELCRDPVQHRLVEEVSEITNTVDALKSKLRMAENALQQLLRTKSTLEQDLSVKNNSLFIDRESCMGMRKTFPMSPRMVAV